MGPNIFSNNLSQISVLVYTESFLSDKPSFDAPWSQNRTECFQLVQVFAISFKIPLKNCFVVDNIANFFEIPDKREQMFSCQI